MFPFGILVIWVKTMTQLPSLSLLSRSLHHLKLTLMFHDFSPRPP